MMRHGQCNGNATFGNAAAAQHLAMQRATTGGLHGHLQISKNIYRYQDLHSPVPVPPYARYTKFTHGALGTLKCDKLAHLAHYLFFSVPSVPRGKHGGLSLL